MVVVRDFLLLNKEIPLSVDRHPKDASGMIQYVVRDNHRVGARLIEYRSNAYVRMSIIPRMTRDTSSENAAEGGGG